MSDWEFFCKKFEAITCTHKELASLRIELFHTQQRNVYISTLKIIYWTLKLIRGKCMFKKIQPHSIHSIYFITEDLATHLGTIQPLFSRDANPTLIATQQLFYSKKFVQIRKKYDTYNYEHYLGFHYKDIKQCFHLTQEISKTVELPFHIVLASVFKYLMNKNSFEYLFSKINAQFYFSTMDISMDCGLAIYYAKQMKMHNYILQHGALVPEYVPVTTDNYIVWGSVAKTWFINHHVGCKLLALGTPRIDQIYILKKQEVMFRHQLREKYNIPSDKKIFLFLSHSKALEFGIDVHIKNFEALKTVINNPSYQLVVKLHPLEKQSLFNKILDDQKKKIILLPRDDDIYQTILASDICASTFSTTLVEAMCLGKPTIQMNMAQIDNLPDYSQQDGCIYVDTPNTLNYILNKKDLSFELERQNTYVKKYFNNLGHSTDCIIDLINKIAKR